MIVIDTETTSFTKPDVVALEHQPEIIEFAWARLDIMTLELLDESCFFIRPKIFPLDEKIVKATGITNEMVAGAKPFSAFVNQLTHAFLGEEMMVAHNAGFDHAVMIHELTRLDRQFRFPWPHNIIDTVEMTMDIPFKRTKSQRLKLSELHMALFGTEPAVKHRALDDVHTLVACLRGLRARDGRI